MKIECFPIKMKEEEALKIAAGGKNPIIRLLFGKKKINLRVMYLESRYIIYEMTYHDNFLVKAINKKKRKTNRKSELWWRLPPVLQLMWRMRL